MQQPPIQLPNACFYSIESLMDILKKIGIQHWSMLFHCSTFIAIQILPNFFKNCIHYVQIFLKTLQMFLLMRFGLPNPL